MTHSRSLPLLFGLALLPACFGLGDLSGGEANFGSDTGELGENDRGTDTGDGDGDGDGDPSSPDQCQCGDEGTCHEIDGNNYCECPEGTLWQPHSCEACPVVAEGGAHDLDVPAFLLSGRFTLNGLPTPKTEFDDANIYIENLQTGDRVLLGNTQYQNFSVRVTPGVYDVIYELESSGATLPQNQRMQLRKLAVFEDSFAELDIPVATVTATLEINGVAPPVTEFDDANIYLRDRWTGNEVFVANTQAGGFTINLVPGTYDVIYRHESQGPVMPRNIGAKLQELSVAPGGEPQVITIASVPVTGEFLIGGVPAPPIDFQDGNIELESPELGAVVLGNTHDSSYAVNLIPGEYSVIYMHESGLEVPRNQRARVSSLSILEAGEQPIDVPMIELSGALTINGDPAPASEFDDGDVYLRGVGSDDVVPLGSTRTGGYQVRLVPGSYDLFYSLETAGATVPRNKNARLKAAENLAETGTFDVDIEAVTISGSFTLAGAPPPASEYEDGRVYLRDLATDDAILLGSTHEGAYTALVVPGDYEAFYVQEAGGGVPGNQNARLQSVSVVGPTNVDFDIPAVSLSGQILLNGADAPDDPQDGGQLYLRALAGDSVLLGDSFAAGYGATLVAGTYGVYYRTEASLTTPQNINGRFACVTVNPQ